MINITNIRNIKDPGDYYKNPQTNKWKNLEEMNEFLDLHSNKTEP